MSAAEKRLCENAAVRCYIRGKQCDSADAKADFQSMERRWNRLVQSWEFVGHLQRFLDAKSTSSDPGGAGMTAGEVIRSRRNMRAPGAATAPDPPGAGLGHQL